VVIYARAGPGKEIEMALRASGRVRVNVGERGRGGKGDG
jgi:hypothetical protein